MSVDLGTAYAVFYVCVVIPAALVGLWRASLIPPTHTYDDDQRRANHEHRDRDRLRALTIKRIA